MTTDLYDPSEALTAYYEARTTRQIARHWAVEKQVHDDGHIGKLSYFEGAGSDPTALSGYASTKLWLRVESGVTASPGTVRAWNGVSPESSLSNWPTLTPGAYGRHLLGLATITPGTYGSSYPSRAALAAASVSVVQLYADVAGYASAGDGGAARYKRAASEPAHAGKVQSADGAWWEIYDDVLSIKMFGALGDGTTDDITAINNALALGRDTFAPKGIYRTTATITMNNIGQRFWGEFGGNDTQILADHTAGPVISMLQRQCALHDLYLNASNTRNAAAVTTNNHGVLMGGSGSGSMTSTDVRRVIVDRQPANSFHFPKLGISSIFSQCQALYGRGHGFYFDQGTYDGLTASRPGIVRHENCRALHCGGNALAGAPNGGSSLYRFVIENFEVSDCAWNTAISGLDDCQLYMLGNSVEIKNCAFGDGDWADTTMPNGDARLAKSAVGAGVIISGLSNVVSLRNNRYLFVDPCVQVGTGASGITIDEAFVGGTVGVLGYDIGSSTEGVWIRVSDSANYGTIVDSETNGNIVFVGDQEYRTVAGSSLMFALRKTEEVEIVSGSLNARSSIVRVKGQGDTTDTLGAIYFASSGVPLPDGFEFTLVNLNAYTITITHAGTNIYSNSGSNISLTQNKAARFVAYGGNIYEA